MAENPSNSSSNSGSVAGARTTPVLVPQGELLGRPDIPLDRAVTTVGSGDTNRLHLLSRSISKAHALFVNSGATNYIVDLASRTGVQVNGRPVKDADLKTGDRVQIGKFLFRFRSPRGSAPSSAQKFAPPVALRINGEPPSQFTGRTILIGRRDSNDVPLMDDPAVSTAHAILFQAEGQWYLRDLSSRTGTKLNGVSIHQKSIKFGDRFQIGAATLSFEEGSGITTTAPEAQGLEFLDEAPQAPAISQAAPAAVQSAVDAPGEEALPIEPLAESLEPEPPAVLEPVATDVETPSAEEFHPPDFTPEVTTPIESDEAVDKPQTAALIAPEAELPGEPPPSPDRVEPPAPIPLGDEPAESDDSALPLAETTDELEFTSRGGWRSQSAVEPLPLEAPALPVEGPAATSAVPPPEQPAPETVAENSVDAVPLEPAAQTSDEPSMEALQAEPPISRTVVDPILTDVDDVDGLVFEEPASDVAPPLEQQQAPAAQNATVPEPATELSEPVIPLETETAPADTEPPAAETIEAPAELPEPAIPLVSETAAIDIEPHAAETIEAPADIFETPVTEATESPVAEVTPATAAEVTELPAAEIVETPPAEAPPTPAKRGRPKKSQAAPKVERRKKPRKNKGDAAEGESATSPVLDDAATLAADAIGAEALTVTSSQSAAPIEPPPDANIELVDTAEATQPLAEWDAATTPEAAAPDTSATDVSAPPASEEISSLSDTGFNRAVEAFTESSTGPLVESPAPAPAIEDLAVSDVPASEEIQPLEELLPVESAEAPPAALEDEPFASAEPVADEPAVEFEPVPQSVSETSDFSVSSPVGDVEPMVDADTQLVADLSSEAQATVEEVELPVEEFVDDSILDDLTVTDSLEGLTFPVEPVSVQPEPIEPAITTTIRDEALAPAVESPIASPLAPLPPSPAPPVMTPPSADDLLSYDTAAPGRAGGPSVFGFDMGAGSFLGGMPLRLKDPPATFGKIRYSFDTKQGEMGGLGSAAMLGAAPPATAPVAEQKSPALPIAQTPPQSEAVDATPEEFLTESAPVETIESVEEPAAIAPSPIQPTPAPLKTASAAPAIPPVAPTPPPNIPPPAGGTGRSLTDLAGAASGKRRPNAPVTLGESMVIPPIARPSASAAPAARMPLSTAFDGLTPGTIRVADVFSQMERPISPDTFGARSANPDDFVLGDPAHQAQLLPGRGGSKGQPPTAPPPGQSAAQPSAARRRMHVPMLVLMMIVSAAAMIALVYWLIPQTTQITGALTFQNLTAQPELDQRLFKAEQIKRLRTDESVRVVAKTTLISRNVPTGLLDSAISLDEAMANPRNQFDFKGDSLVISYLSPDGDNGREQVKALLDSLAHKDQDLSDALSRARSDATNARNAVTKASLVVEDLKRQIATLTPVGEDRPGLDAVARLQAQAGRQEKARQALHNITTGAAAALEKLRTADPSKDVDPDSDPVLAQLREQLELLNNLIATLKAPAASPDDNPASAPASQQAVAVSGDDPLLKQLTDLAEKTSAQINPRLAQVQAQKVDSPDQREVDRQKAQEDLSIRLTALRGLERDAATAATTAANQLKDVMARRARSSEATDQLVALGNQKGEADAALKNASADQAAKEAALAHCVAVAGDAQVSAIATRDQRPKIAGGAAGVIVLVFFGLILHASRPPAVRTAPVGQTMNGKPPPATYGDGYAMPGSARKNGTDDGQEVLPI